MLRALAAGLLALVMGVIVGACFNAPQPAVQFSCDPVDAPQCPPGYSCESDGCCHRDGSDVAAHQGECELGGLLPTGGGSASSSSTGSSGDTASATDDSGTTAESSSSSDATTSTGPGGSSSSG